MIAHGWPRGIATSPTQIIAHLQIAVKYFSITTCAAAHSEAAHREKTLYTLHYKGAVSLVDDVEKGILRNLQDEHRLEVPAFAGLDREHVGQFIVGLPKRDELVSAEQDIWLFGSCRGKYSFSCLVLEPHKAMH
jgi:hypothetical protein